MSIIHDALKRKTLAKLEIVKGGSEGASSASPAPPAVSPTLLVGVIGAASLALVAYIAGRPPEVNVFNMTKADPAPAQVPAIQAPPPVAAEVSNEPLMLTESQDPYIPYTFSGNAISPIDENGAPSIMSYGFYPSEEPTISMMPSDRTATAVTAMNTTNATNSTNISGEPTIISVKPVAVLPADAQQVRVSEVPSVQVVNATRPLPEPVAPVRASEPVAPAAPAKSSAANSVGSDAPVITMARPSQIPVAMDDLPSGAVTIEMSSAKLESVSGTVALNGASTSPGSQIRVGSMISTEIGEASIAFQRASLEIGPNTNARVTRLERHGAGGAEAKEEVTVDLQKGELSAIVNLGQGSVLISTPEVIASTSNGAFRAQTNADRSVTITSIGGMIKVVPLANRKETYIVKTNESLTFRKGKPE